MHQDTLLLRQVHPSFVQANNISSQVFNITSQVFRPTPKDENNDPFDGHAIIDFTNLTNGQIDKKAKNITIAGYIQRMAP